MSELNDILPIQSLPLKVAMLVAALGMFQTTMALCVASLLPMLDLPGRGQSEDQSFVTFVCDHSSSEWTVSLQTIQCLPSESVSEPLV